MTEADDVLNEAGVFMIPDILCNAGGVTVSYFEWVQGGMHFFWSADEIDSRLSRLLRQAFSRVVAESKRLNVTMRKASLALAIRSVDEVMRSRGLYA